MKIEHLAIDDLAYWEENPRTITTDQFKKLCHSMKEDPHFFDMRPILVSYKNDINLIYAGNQRVRAAKSIGLKKVPCIVEEDLSEETMKRRSILDNKTYGTWDLDMLANEWDTDLLADCGFTDEELCFDKNEKEVQKKFKIILEFKDEDSLNEVLPQMNQYKSLCQMKVKM